jgi:hypothetical protein
MLPFPVRLGGRVEEIQEHVPGRRDLGQEQLHRVDGTLPGRLERQFAEPFGDRFTVALGGGFDLGKLFRSGPGGNGLGAETGLFGCVGRGLRGATGSSNGENRLFKRLELTP